MGGSASRNVAFHNPEPINVIQITEQVLDRLKGQLAQDPPSRSSSVPHEPEKPRKTIESELIDKPAMTTSVEIPPPPLPVSTDPTILVNGDKEGNPLLQTVTSFQLRQKHLEEVKELDRKWIVKLRELEEKYIAANNLAEDAYKTKIEKLEGIMPKAPKVVCQLSSKKLAKCYESSRPLECAHLVEELARCVDAASSKSQV